MRWSSSIGSASTRQAKGTHLFVSEPTAVPRLLLEVVAEVCTPPLLDFRTVHFPEFKELLLCRLNLAEYA